MNSDQLSTLSKDLFGMVSSLNNTIFDPHELLKCMPFPPSHVKVIFYLYHSGASTMTDLAQNLGISKPNLTPIVDKLITENLVKRLDNPKDRRVVMIDITENAVELFKAHREMMFNLLVERISVLPTEDLYALQENVRNILPILHKLAPHSHTPHKKR